MSDYYIYTDAESQRITAENVDAAIAKFDPTHPTWAELARHIEAVGGWAGVQENGVELLYAGKR